MGEMGKKKPPGLDGRAGSSEGLGIGVTFQGNADARKTSIRRQNMNAARSTQASEADQIEARRKALIKNAGALRIFLPKAKIIQPKHNPQRPKAGGKAKGKYVPGTFGAAGPVRRIDPASAAMDGTEDAAAASGFALTYARYAASQRAKGRKPKPPLTWIKDYRAKAAGGRGQW
jgi:hypothetical protein